MVQGPGYYAIGRGYLLLGELETARRHLERAVELEYEEPEVSYALGLTYGELYKSALEKGRTTAGPEEMQRLRQELDRLGLSVTGEEIDRTIYSIARDSADRVWIGSRNGVTFGRWDDNNPMVLAPEPLKENRYYVVAGRMGVGSRGPRRRALRGRGGPGYPPRRRPGRRRPAPSRVPRGKRIRLNKNRPTSGPSS